VGRPLGLLMRRVQATEHVPDSRRGVLDAKVAIYERNDTLAAQSLRGEPVISQPCGHHAREAWYLVLAQLFGTADDQICLQRELSAEPMCICPLRHGRGTWPRRGPGTSPPSTPADLRACGSLRSLRFRCVPSMKCRALRQKHKAGSANINRIQNGAPVDEHVQCRSAPSVAAADLGPALNNVDLRHGDPAACHQIVGSCCGILPFTCRSVLGTNLASHRWL